MSQEAASKSTLQAYGRETTVGSLKETIKTADARGASVWPEAVEKTPSQVMSNKLT